MVYYEGFKCINENKQFVQENCLVEKQNLSFSFQRIKYKT